MNWRAQSFRLQQRAFVAQSRAKLMVYYLLLQIFAGLCQIKKPDLLRHIASALANFFLNKLAAALSAKQPVSASYVQASMAGINEWISSALTLVQAQPVQMQRGREWREVLSHCPLLLFIYIHASIALTMPGYSTIAPSILALPVGSFTIIVSTKMKVDCGVGCSCCLQEVS